MGCFRFWGKGKFFFIFFLWEGGPDVAGRTEGRGTVKKGNAGGDWGGAGPQFRCFCL